MHENISAKQNRQSYPVDISPASVFAFPRENRCSKGVARNMELPHLSPYYVLSDISSELRQCLLGHTHENPARNVSENACTYIRRTSVTEETEMNSTAMRRSPRLFTVKKRHTASPTRSFSTRRLILKGGKKLLRN